MEYIYHEGEDVSSGECSTVSERVFTLGKAGRFYSLTPGPLSSLRFLWRGVGREAFPLRGSPGNCDMQP